MIWTTLTARGIHGAVSYQPIENHGVIGDLHTVALVGMDGSIDFMCAPHFDYARSPHTVERTADGVLFAGSGNHAIALRLRSEVPLRIEDGAALAEFTLRGDESAAFVLEQVRPGEDGPAAAPDYAAE